MHQRALPGSVPRTGIAVSAGLWALVPVAVFAASPESSSGPTETVVVKGQRLTVETRIDRKIYHVPDDAQSALGSLSDILNVIPSIDVDPDGVVSLRGDTNVLILIDGKPASQLQGSKAGDNLQSISAVDIGRIEVLTTPPAQFKAEGTAGVINIITRKRAARGAASSSLQGSLGDGGRWLVGGNGSYGGKQYTVSLNAGFRADYRQREIQSQLIGPDPTTGQVLASRDQASQRIRRQAPTVRLSGGYDPGERQSLSGSASWSRRGGLRTYTQFDDSSLPSGAVTSSTRRITSGHDPENDYDTALRFTQKFSKPGETLDLTAHRSSSHQHEHYDYTNDSLVPPAPTFYNNLSFTEDHGVTEGDVDYALPLSQAQSLKLGYAFEQDDYGFDNTGASVDPVSGVQTVDPSLTNEFKFHQRIHAIYQSYQGSAGAWTGLAGIRAEWTSTDAVQLTDKVSTARRYAGIYPSLHVERSLTDRSTLSFGASRRVTRPDPGNLNPYVDHEYPPNLNAGNPNLRPQYTQSFEVGYGYDGPGASYGLTGYFRRNKDSVTDVTEYLGNGLSLTTKTNLPRNDSSGLEFSANRRLLQSLSGSVSGNAFYSQIDATALGFPGLKSTTGVNLKARLDFRPTAADSVQLTFTRTDKRLTPQGSVSALNIVNLGYKRAITSAVSAVATVSDLFDGQVSQRAASSATLIQIYERSYVGRIVFIGLVYTVGATKKEKQPDFDYESGG